MTINIKIESSAVVIDKSTRPILELYQEILARIVPKSDEQVSLAALGATTPCKSFFIDHIQLVLPGILGKMVNGVRSKEAELPPLNLELSPAAEVLLENYLSLLNDALLKQDITAEDAEKTRAQTTTVEITSKYVLVRELYYHLFAIALSNNFDARNDGDLLLNAVEELTKGLAKRKLLLDKPSFFFKKKVVSSFSGHLNEHHSTHLDLSRQCVAALKLLHTNHEAMNLVLTGLRTHSLTIKRQIIAVIGKTGLTSADFNEKWLTTNFRGCHQELHKKLERFKHLPSDRDQKTTDAIWQERLNTARTRAALDLLFDQTDKTNTQSLSRLSIPLDAAVVASKIRHPALSITDQRPDPKHLSVKDLWSGDLTDEQYDTLVCLALEQSKDYTKTLTKVNKIKSLYYILNFNQHLTQMFSNIDTLIQTIGWVLVISGLADFRKCTALLTDYIHVYNNAIALTKEVKDLLSDVATLELHTHLAEGKVLSSDLMPKGIEALEKLSDQKLRKEVKKTILGSISELVRLQQSLREDYQCINVRAEDINFSPTRQIIIEEVKDSRTSIDSVLSQQITDALSTPITQKLTLPAASPLLSITASPTVSTLAKPMTSREQIPQPAEFRRSAQMTSREMPPRRATTSASRDVQRSTKSRVTFSTQVERPNVRYEYEEYDIQAILRARITELCGYIPDHIQDLAAVDSVAIDQLSDRLVQDQTANAGQARKLLIPCNIGLSHWTGLFFDLAADNTILRCVYMDSLSDPVRPLVPRGIPESLLCQLQKVYKDHVPEYVRVLTQDDITSCGAYTIEHLLIAAKLLEPHSQTTLEIRQRHLAALRTHNSKYYSEFYPRQRDNRPTTASLAVQMGYVQAMSTVRFSPLELARIILSSQFLHSITQTEIQTALWFALQPQAETPTEHYGRIRSALNQAHQIISSDDKLTDRFSFVQLIQLWFKAESCSTFSDFQITHEEILAIAQCQSTTREQEQAMMQAITAHVAKDPTSTSDLQALIARFTRHPVSDPLTIDQTKTLAELPAQIKITPSLGQQRTDKMPKTVPSTPPDSPADTSSSQTSHIKTDSTQSMPAPATPTPPAPPAPAAPEENSEASPGRIDKTTTTDTADSRIVSRAKYQNVYKIQEFLRNAAPVKLSKITGAELDKLACYRAHTIKTQLFKKEQRWFFEKICALIKCYKGPATEQLSIFKNFRHIGWSLESLFSLRTYTSNFVAAMDLIVKHQATLDEAMFDFVMSYLTMYLYKMSQELPWHKEADKLYKELTAEHKIVPRDDVLLPHNVNTFILNVTSTEERLYFQITQLQQKLDKTEEILQSVVEVLTKTRVALADQQQISQRQQKHLEASEVQLQERDEQIKVLNQEMKRLPKGEASAVKPSKSSGGLFSSKPASGPGLAPDTSPLRSKPS